MQALKTVFLCASVIDRRLRFESIETRNKVGARGLMDGSQIWLINAT